MLSQIIGTLILRISVWKNTVYVPAVNVLFVIQDGVLFAQLHYNQATQFISQQITFFEQIAT